jgi:hypothetical protein
MEQSPARQEQIRQRCGDFKPVQVLRQASITHLLKTEDPLDHPKHVLDLGAHAGLATVGGFDRLIDWPLRRRALTLSANQPPTNRPMAPTAPTEIDDT